MMYQAQVVSLVLMLGMLSSCGETPGQRALTGAGIGAGVGAVGAGVTGGSVGTGALVGGALGGVTGAVTKKKDLDLGKSPFE